MLIVVCLFFYFLVAFVTSKGIIIPSGYNPAYEVPMKYKTAKNDEMGISGAMPVNKNYLL